MDAEKSVFIATQAYVPDSAAAGQYMAEVAEAMAGRGWRVTVVAPERGYNEPGRRTTGAEECPAGLSIHRVGGPPVQKENLSGRLCSMIVFSLRAAMQALFHRRPCGMLVSSSPPMLPVFMMTIARLRRIPLVYWVMDLNPDQAIESGMVSANAWSTRMLAASQRWVLGHAAVVIVLDRFMENRVRKYAKHPRRLEVLPLWPLEKAGNREESAAIRERHGWSNHFVVMYSGNHSPVHPLDTMLDAARNLRNDARFKFVFVGGGLAKAAIEQTKVRENLEHVIVLASQPLGELHAMLGAADVQIVSMGEKMSGCVHPSKVYNILTAGRPFVLLGSPSNSVSDLLERHGCGWRIAHGDSDGFVRMLCRLASAEGHRELEEKRLAAARVYCDDGAVEAARNEWLDVVLSAMGGTGS